MRSCGVFLLYESWCREHSFSFVFSSSTQMLPRPKHVSSGTLCLLILSLISTIMTRRAWLPLFLCIYNKLLFKATKTMIKHSLLEWGQTQQQSPFSTELMVQWLSLRVAVPPVGDSLKAAMTWEILFALLEHHFFIYAMELIQSAFLISSSILYNW